MSLTYTIYKFKDRLKRWWRWLRWTSRLLLALALVDFGYVLALLPDWTHLSNGPIQKSAFIKAYEYQRALTPSLPPLRWRPVAIERIAPQLIQAVVVAEDSRFYQHHGIDTEAVKSAMEYNLTQQRFVYGGSTISQQMIKNMLLSPSRDPLRKWHELWLTLSLERHLDKQRILEIYLNVAEFGRGVYGVEAAARYYWKRSSRQLDLDQAIELAATLSGPIHNNPETRTPYFLQQKAKIRRNMGLPE